MNIKHAPVVRSVSEFLRNTKSTYGLSDTEVVQLLADFLIANTSRLEAGPAGAYGAYVHHKVNKAIRKSGPLNIDRLKAINSDDARSVQQELQAKSMRDADMPNILGEGATPCINDIRMMRLDEPVAFLGEHIEKSSSWLTVGDGRYGMDAINLAKMGFTDVTASDICGEVLETAYVQGMIAKYSVENAESLSFADKSFDYILCREAYHHIPRAPLAFYEMARVARSGFVLVEPQDPAIDPPIRYDANDSFWYEECANFVFSLSRREVLKMAYGMNLHSVAFKNINDHYDKQMCSAPAIDGSPEYRRWLDIIANMDVQVEQGLASSAYLLCIVFLRPPAPELVNSLKEAGWDLVGIPLFPAIWDELKKKPAGSSE